MSWESQRLWATVIVVVVAFVVMATVVIVYVGGCP